MKWLGLGVLVIVVILLLRQLTTTKTANSSTSSPSGSTPQPNGGNTATTSPITSINGFLKDSLDNLTEAGARVEGFYKQGSKAQRTNNPGMIGGDSSKGFVDVGDGWDRFYSYDANLAAKHPDWNFYDFYRYYLTGDTMGTPGPGQNPDAYAEYVAGYVGADPTQSVYDYLMNGAGA